jgi:RNA polymerase sigma factor (sigma-70 family)
MGLGRSPQVGPEVIVVQNEQDAEVMAAVARLNPRDREILLLTVWEELTAREIGVALNISTAAAEKRLLRAKKRFARMLDGWFAPAKTSSDDARNGGKR